MSTQPAVGGARRRALLSRLPAFYREQPGFVDPLIGAAEALLEDFQSLLERTEKGLLARPESASAWRLCRDEPALFEGEKSVVAGTLEGLLGWTEDRIGHRPRASTGLCAVNGPDGWIELRRVSCPSVLLLWERSQLPSVPEAFEIPSDFLPATVSVQAILTSRLPALRRLLPGERVQGVVFWALLRGEAPEGPEIQEKT